MAPRDVPPPSKYERENHEMRQWVPIPDPTTLTTEQLRRELAALREILETRLDAMDKAVNLLHEITNRQPTIAEVVARYDEKLDAINVKVADRKDYFDLRDADNKRALDSALTASKEAAAKTEASFTKQIDQLNELAAVSSKAESARIDDIRTRLTAIEGRAQAYSQGFTYIATAIGIVAAIVGAVVALFFNKTVGI